MLFSEIYSAYYQAAASLINAAISGELTAKNAEELIASRAFRESFVYILDAIRREDWKIITRDFRTSLRYSPQTPLSTLELRFLKAITLDDRFRLLYDGEPRGLDEVEPLFTPADFHFFDLISDGDPYTDVAYRNHFRTVWKALKEERRLRISFRDGKCRDHTGIYTPRKLEYSEKDDKFRLLCQGRYQLDIINLARIYGCEILEAFDEEVLPPLRRRTERVLIRIRDQRNALERCMLGFADYAKETRQTGKDEYEMELTYYKSDETEVLIRVLSFGPLVQVLAPEGFIRLIRARLDKQRQLW